MSERMIENTSADDLFHMPWNALWSQALPIWSD
jgi:hypothetical protein